MKSAKGLKIYVADQYFPWDLYIEFGMKPMLFEDIEKADLVVLTGGEDINPALYGEKPIAGVHWRSARDGLDRDIFRRAMNSKIPVIGICRGAQLAHTLIGVEHNYKNLLWQDVNNHGRADGHRLYDFATHCWHTVTSCHHQQMRIPGEYRVPHKIVAAASESTSKAMDGYRWKYNSPETPLDDLEVLWYPREEVLCYQPHPEFGNPFCKNYFLSLCQRFCLFEAPVDPQFMPMPTMDDPPEIKNSLGYDGPVEPRKTQVVVQSIKREIRNVADLI